MNLGKRIQLKVLHYLRKFNKYAMRKARKFKRIFLKEKHDLEYTLAITCVKRPEYIDLALKNINSLHYINPNHKFVVYTDNACAEAFNKRKRRLDYPKHVTLNNAFKEGGQPWQHYKLETIIEISKKGWMLVDADALWHDDPIIDQERITLLVNPNKIKEKAEESKVVTEIFNKPEWLDWGYYSSGFVSIPAKFMTDELADKSREFLKVLLYDDYNFIEGEEARGAQKRQAEQFALNLGILNTYPESVMTTLKETDGVKSKHILQSLYYGCEHKINE